MTVRQKLAFSIVLLIASAAARAAEPPPPSISFETNAIAVSGATPRGRVVLFGVVRMPLQYTVGIRKAAVVLHDVDGDGAVRHEIKMPAGFQAVFAAVDFDSGRYSIAAPPGQSLQASTVPIGAFLRKSDNELVRMLLERTYLDVVCVRPRHAAWYLALGDGSAADADKKTDGKLAFDAEQMEPVTSGAARFKHFKKRDVVILIGAETLEVMATEVAE